MSQIQKLNAATLANIMNKIVTLNGEVVILNGNVVTLG